MASHRFDGKKALVTGGSRGLGKAIVKALINEGAIVFALGKSKENLDKLKAETPSVHVIQADVSDWDYTKNVVEQIGIIDLLVNNAGIALPLTKFWDIKQRDLDTIIDTNFKSAFNISQIVTRGLISSGRSGAIVNMSSITTKIGFPGALPYSTSKAMLEMMTETMAMELGSHKIRVNSVNPTFVRTDMTEMFYKDEALTAKFIKKHPLGKFADIKDVVDATLFLLSDKASMITGTCLPVDGGWSVS